MNLPNVLIIGAMKSGTTGLYMDLATHPDVFLAQDKEPQSLCHSDVVTYKGRRRYAALYEKASVGQVVVDASTNYAKLPDHGDVVERALQVLPAGFKVVYMVRHPIDRIISQHYEEFSRGFASKEVDNEVRRHSRYVNYSSYAYQLQPWLEAIGRERVLVVRFEDYAADRCESVEQVCDFLHLSPNRCRIELNTIYNHSGSKHVTNGFWKSVARSSLYKIAIRKLLPPKQRLRLRRWVLPSAPEKPQPPTQETLCWLRQAVVDDVLQLHAMLEVKEPLWPDFATSLSNRPSSRVSHHAICCPSPPVGQAQVTQL